MKVSRPALSAMMIHTMNGFNKTGKFSRSRNPPRRNTNRISFQTVGIAGEMVLSLFASMYTGARDVVLKRGGQRTNPIGVAISDACQG